MLRRPKRPTMPHFTVKLHEEMLDGSTERKLIEALTNAATEVYGEDFRPLVVVELFGIPRHRWGSGGAPATREAVQVTLNMREAGLTRLDPAIPITSITDAATEVFGTQLREDVAVHLVGVPAGRSGVGGEVA
ncbi:4-oxalocrotonate tautomerase family protein [Saccharopolyspora sp. 5N102]|uniref:4-oxalocrotonate tautomerase family protein n=1 Tax=Saccharopolyspora sp. 5N102 TaxID=3375155 RepID=UPI0037A78281